MSPWFAKYSYQDTCKKDDENNNKNDSSGNEGCGRILKGDVPSRQQDNEFIVMKQRLPTRINGLLVVTRRRVLWPTFFSLLVTVTFGWELYQWYLTGQLYAPSKSKSGNWIRYFDDPGIFIYLACMAVSSFVFFGVGSVYWMRMLLLHRYIDPEVEPLPRSD
ncbi:MAG: hypothetical protein ACRC9K_24085 [Afipia sp.]